MSFCPEGRAVCAACAKPGPKAGRMFTKELSQRTQQHICPTPYLIGLVHARQRALPAQLDARRAGAEGWESPCAPRASPPSPALAMAAAVTAVKRVQHGRHRCGGGEYLPQILLESRPPKLVPISRVLRIPFLLYSSPVVRGRIGDGLETNRGWFGEPRRWLCLSRSWGSGGHYSLVIPL
eukprot:gene23070-biopygen13343